MLGYHLRIALKSLRRTPWLSALLIGGIALGICISTTLITVRHLFAKNPVPGKSQRLFYVRMDNWDPARPYPGDDPNPLPPQITLRDMTELMKSKIPVHQTGDMKTGVIVYPSTKNVRPYNEIARLCFSDFFTMFNVPFRFGGPWDSNADAKPEAVVILDEATNQKLFGGTNSVGKSLRIQDRDFRVVGVLAHWRPSTRYYDFTQAWIAAPEAIYMPFNLMRGMQLRPAGNVDGWKSNGSTWEENMMSETTFIQFWVEMPDTRSLSAYRDFVDSYVREQKKLGRFQRPLNNRIVDMETLMKEWKIVSPEMNAMAVVSLLFLAVCALNLSGLLLGKFLARLPEVSVRRALGATKFDVFAQHVVECEVIGVAGGVLGLGLSLIALAIVNRLLPFGALVRLDGEMLMVALFFSLCAGLIAGLYPAWRVCSVAPAMQLKAQ